MTAPTRRQALVASGVIAAALVAMGVAGVPHRAWALRDVAAAPEYWLPLWLTGVAAAVLLSRRPWPRWLVTAAAVGLPVVALVLWRSNLADGDGPEWVVMAETDWSVALREPLACLLERSVYLGLHALVPSLDGADTVAILATACGAAALLFAWRIAGRFESDPAPRWRAAYLLWLGGYTPLFFGYLETYAPLLLATMAALDAGLGALERPERLWRLGIAAGVAAALHLLGALLIVPCLAAASMVRRAAGVRGIALAAVAGLLPLVLTALAIVGIERAGLGHTPLGVDPAGGLRLDMLVPIAAPGQFGWFSAEHAVYVINALLLGAPAALVLAPQLLLPAADASVDRRRLRFAVAAAAPMAAFLLFWYPWLDEADWSLFVLPALSFNLVVVARLGTRRPVASPRAVGLAVAVAVLVVGARVTIQADATPAAMHARIAFQHAHVGNSEGMCRHLDEALRDVPDPRLLLARAGCREELGERQGAIADYRAALAAGLAPAEAEGVRRRLGRLVGTVGAR